MMKGTLWKRFLMITTAVCLLLTVTSCRTDELVIKKYETREVTVNESFDSILIDVRTADIDLSSVSGEACKAELTESSGEQYDISVQDGVLTVCEKNAPWYERVTLLSAGSPKIAVQIPEKEYERLVLKNSTGDISLLSVCCGGEIDITLSTGDILLSDISCGNLVMSGSTGDDRLENVTVSGSISGTRSTGDRKLTGVSCEELVLTGSTGDDLLEDVIASEHFSVVRSTGDISMKRCDGEKIVLETDTGDITGSLLTGKMFEAFTDTGKATVPEDVSGGSCKITTGTGDIRISVS